MTNITNNTNNPQTRMKSNSTARRHYWNGRESVPMPKTSRLEKILGALVLSLIVATLCTAYAKVLTHHDTAARAAYSNR